MCSLAAEYRKSTAQVLLKWALQHDVGEQLKFVYVLRLLPFVSMIGRRMYFHSLSLRTSQFKSQFV